MRISSLAFGSLAHTETTFQEFKGAVLSHQKKMFVDEKVCISLEFDNTLTSVKINTSSHPEDLSVTSKRYGPCIYQDTVIKQKINILLEFKDTITNLSIRTASDPEDISVTMKNDEFFTFKDIVISGIINMSLEISEVLTNFKISTFLGHEDIVDDKIGIYLKIKDKMIKEQVSIYMEFDDSLVGMKIRAL